MNRKIMSVGAYERDNFGDLLFLIQLKKYLSDFDIVASSPFEGKVDDLVKEKVYRYQDVLETKDLSGYWVVGGEVGGTLFDRAYRNYAEGQDVTNFERLDKGEQIGEINRVSGLSSTAVSPYVPRIVNKGKLLPSVINSVGLDGLRKLPYRNWLLIYRTLKEASYVSVRESASSRVLKRLGVKHDLVPDIMHSILITDPNLKEPRNESPYALLHMKAGWIQKYGVGAIADSILAVDDISKGSIELRLFVAGSAAGHDSIELYEALIADLREKSSRVRVEIDETVDPIEKVKLIANAKIWIGTSLHGLILSTAYAVPHICLKLRKLEIYASTWQDPMPRAVEPSGIARAWDVALDPNAAADLATQAERLADLADKGALRAVEGLKRGLEAVDLQDVKANVEQQPGLVSLLNPANIFKRIKVIK